MSYSQIIYVGYTLQLGQLGYLLWTASTIFSKAMTLSIN